MASPSDDLQQAAIAAHIDRYLGGIREEWQADEDAGLSAAVALARYAVSLAEGWSVVGTIGLSQFPLTQADGSALRQELLTCWPQASISDALLAQLYTAAQILLASGEALGHGVLLPLLPGTLLPSGGLETFCAWYVSVPLFLPEAAVLLRETEPPLVFAWLVPVYEDEANFIAEHGAEWFEEILFASRPGFFSRPRASLLRGNIG